MDDVRRDHPNYQDSIREISEDQSDLDNGDTIVDEQLFLASEHLVILYKETIERDYGRQMVLDLIHW